MATLKVGDQAPDFTLKGAGGVDVSLASFRGTKTVVLYFYPKDETLGCTRESCHFRDRYEDFTEAGAEVIGVSTDTVDSHDAFKAHHRLPFVLASDPGGAVRARYGVKPSFFGMLPGRVTFVIDREGVVRDVFDSQIRVYEHVNHALDLVRSLEARAAQPAQA